MTMDHDPTLITDEDLSAWLDGALGPDEQARVEAWLHSHPDDAARVRLWEADRSLLRQHFAADVAAPVPPRLRELVLGERRPARSLVALAAAAAVAGIVVGALGMHQWDRRQAVATQARAPVPWVERAALAHAVYVPEPRHAVEVKAQEEHLARWLTRRIDIPVKLFDLHAQGFELIGGRLLPDGTGKSAQLMYQDAQGRRVTVYLRKPEAGTPVAFRYEQQGELGLFYWIESGAGYALVGALPKATLLALAQAIYQQHPDVKP